VTISDYVDTYLGDEILFCSYSLNSTVGYIGYDIYDFRYENITLNVLTHLISDTDWEKYMWVGLGNSKGTATEIVVAIDSSIPDDDSIEVIIPNPLVISDSLQFPSVFDELVFDDIDNDGYDEVMYLVTDTTSFPESNLTIWDYNGSFYREILVETPEKHITAMTAGDLTNDGEIDYVYGTDLLKLWILPEGALWPGEEMGWICNITLLEPWIFQGELATVNVVIENLGDYAINDLDVRLIHNQQVNNEIETIGMISYVAVESTESIFFEMLPISTGNFTLDIQIDSVSPRISHSSKHNILVRPRSAYQAEIGQALLDLALATRNDTLLDAAMKVGNWLDAVKMDLGMRNVAGSVPDNDFIVFSMESCAWNGDANYTDNLLMGSILSTAKTASFLLNLYHATYQYDPYLDTAMQAAYYLANSSLFLQLDPFYVSSTSWTPESIVEISEIGIFLTNINKEFLYDFFNPTITGVANYLCGISQGNPTATNWLQEPGLTQAASKFLAQIEPTETSAFNYTEYSLGAGEWLDDYVESWKNDLNTSIKNGDTYLYYNSTGLAGLGINLADLRDNLESDYSDAMSVIGNNILARRYESSQGFNWNEEYWTLDIDQLANSVNWDYGAAGISVALAEAYKDTGNQSYREVFLKSAEWIHNSINEIAKGTCGWRQIEALADSIQSMIHIHDVLPVIFVGYFVDPMTSLSGYKFTLSGYVQTIGWHANNVSLTVDLPAVFLLSADQNRTIQLGSIGDPGTALVTWEIYLLRYGDYEVTITGNSTNAGSQINTASLTVTDLGVEKIPLDSNGGPLAFKASNKGFIALQVPDILTETLYNIGEQITIPIEALYSHSNESAYNASIQVGEYGTAVVNGSGLGYAIISDWDPGVKEIPISIRYDKVSGITSGTSNITLFMTFSSLEVVQVNVSVNQAQLGQQVTFQGQVCYGHDGSSVAGAMVTLDGELKTVADENGFFTFEHTETEAGIIDYEISAIADGNNHIVMPSLNQTIQVEWIEFWTPITVLLFLGGAAAVVVVLSLGFRRLRPNELST
jgi:hypothetical protein